jgi:hypothetical protein
MLRSGVRKSSGVTWSEVAISHATAEYNSGRMKLAIVGKEFAVPRNTLRRKAAEHSDNDGRGLVAYKRDTALWFENEGTLVEHMLKLQQTGYGLTMTELRKQHM